MPHNPNKLSQFWQELKRRKVIHVITVYASSTFVIIELINNLAEPFNLPSNLLTIVVIVLAIGFPLAVILSWLYDLTGEGIEKTRPLSEVQEGEKKVIPQAWKIATYISFAVILGLVAFNIISSTKKLHPGDIQSLIILPFENFTGDDQLENMIYSMHSLLIGDIGRISGLRVTAKVTSKNYKGTEMSAKDIARECKVDAVMETAIMSLGDSVCMQFSLVSTTGEEKQIWIENYCVDKIKILNLYNKITRQVASEVKIELTPEEERLLSKSRTVDREAYDAYLKGSYLLDDGSEESLYKALEYLNSAIEKDPDWAPLYAGLSSVWLTLAQGFYVSPEIADPKIIAYRDKALELDPDFADIHRMNAGIAFLTEWNWEKAEKEYIKAIAINPSDATSRVLYGQLLCCLQIPGEALRQGQLAIKLDPGNPQVQVWYAAILIGLGDYEAALTIGENLVATRQDHVFGNSIIEGAAFGLKDYEKSFQADKHLLPLEEDTIKEIEAIFDKQGFVAAYEEIAKQMEAVVQKGKASPFWLAQIYIKANQPDKALDWLEKGYEVHDHQMPYIASGFWFLETLYENPRFIAILNKMNLPLPKK